MKIGNVLWKENIEQLNYDGMCERYTCTPGKNMMTQDELFNATAK
jgi:hypothetical protein